MRSAVPAHFAMEKVVDREDIQTGRSPASVLKLRLEHGGFVAFQTSPPESRPDLKVFLQSRTSLEHLDGLEAEVRTWFGREC